MYFKKQRCADCEAGGIALQARLWKGTVLKESCPLQKRLAPQSCGEFDETLGLTGLSGAAACLRAI